MTTRIITLRAQDVERLKDRSVYYLNDQEALIILFTDAVYGRTGPDLPHTLEEAIALAKQYYGASGASMVYAPGRREWIVVFDVPTFSWVKKIFRRVSNMTRLNRKSRTTK